MPELFLPLYACLLLLKKLFLGVGVTYVHRAVCCTYFSFHTGDSICLNVWVRHNTYRVDVAMIMVHTDLLTPMYRQPSINDLISVISQ